MSWNGSDQTSNAAREGTRRTDTRCAPTSGAQSSRCAPASGAQSPRGRISPKCAASGNGAVRRTAPTNAWRGRIPHLRGTLAGLVVVALLGAVTWWFFGGRGATRPAAAPTDRHNSQIATVAPATNAVAKPKEPELVEGRDYVVGKRGIRVMTNGLKIIKDEHGVLRYETGQRVLDPNRPVEKVTPMKTREIFKRSSLNSIATLVTLESGDLLVGDIEYGDEFIKDFNDSLFEEIKAEDGDSEYVAQVKELVKGAQKQLHEMMNRGEDIAQAMNETRRDLRNLFTYRQEIMALVSETADSEASTEQEVEDVVTAANMMFREKGIKEIGDDELVRWNLKFEQGRKKSAAQKESASRNGGEENE